MSPSAAQDPRVKPSRRTVPDTTALEGTIAVDSNNDTSSDYGSSLYRASDLTSLKSSIMNHVYENVLEGVVTMPTILENTCYRTTKENKTGDDLPLLPMGRFSLIEVSLDLHHHIFALALDGHITMAPIKNNIQTVLDIGTGTGIWAIDFADQYPSAEVIGTDLSPIQPSWVPPNCRFEVDDAEQPWLWPNNHFDFIHSRNLTQSIRDWPKLTEEIFNHTKPGGSVELAEIEGHLRCDDGSLSEQSDAQQLLCLLRDAAKTVGLPQPTGEELKNYLESAGFTDMQFHVVKHPWGVWPRDKKAKDIGRVSLLLAEEIFHAHSLALLTRTLGYSVEEANAMCDRAVRDVVDRKAHSYYNMWYIIGRKPGAPEME